MLLSLFCACSNMNLANLMLTDDIDLPLVAQRKAEIRKFASCSALETMFIFRFQSPQIDRDSDIHILFYYFGLPAVAAIPQNRMQRSINAGVPQIFPLAAVRSTKRAQGIILPSHGAST